MAAWAIIMGLTITSLVQVYVSKEWMAQVLADGNLSGLTKTTAFGAASSGCSFGAVAFGKGLFKKGAHAVNFLTFMFVSTDLIVEFGLMILILLGWEFLLAELLGGLILIAIMIIIVHLMLPENLFDEVRETLNERDRESGVTEDPTYGMDGKDEHTLMTDGGETLQFCSEGCISRSCRKREHRDRICVGPAEYSTRPIRRNRRNRSAAPSYRLDVSPEW